MKIANDDWQYLLPFLICLMFFIITDIFRFVDKTSLAYWSGALINEPHRIITSHFIHGNENHLLLNTFGIVFARFCLKSLKLNNNYFFLLLISLLIPLQTIIFWLSDMLIFHNLMSLAIGFSGIIYGLNAFILLASLYGKREFIGFPIVLEKNRQVHQAVLTLTVIGFIWSLLPGISLNGHLSGFIAGSILFLL